MNLSAIGTGLIVTVLTIGGVWAASQNAKWPDDPVLVINVDQQKWDRLSGWERQALLKERAQFLSLCLGSPTDVNPAYVGCVRRNLDRNLYKVSVASAAKLREENK